MKPNQDSILKTRRQFIRQAACAAIGTTALSSILRDLRFVNAAMAQSAISDYKALVCIFLSGGNDANNLILPTTQADYDGYAAIRTPVLAIPQSAILPVSSLNNDGHSYGFHPACPGLQTLFGEGKLAVLFNTGTLAYPITPAQYYAGTVPVPPLLYSHPDQGAQWCTSVCDQAPRTGWGGRCADLLAAVQPDAPISLSVTLFGANLFQVGNLVPQLSVDAAGGVANWTPDPRTQVATNLLSLPYLNMQARAYAKVAGKAFTANGMMSNAIHPTADPYWTAPFPQTFLGSQLKMVARLIEAGNRSVANNGFGMKRQIFFCEVQGYDLHGGQTEGPGATTAGAHANLLAELSGGMLAFQRAMEQLGLSPNVTTFTASEFGRGLWCNTTGTDHAWGSHHLILGGSVNGQRTYGRYPLPLVNGPDTVYTGCWVPSTAIDQYFATLALWFGVDRGNLATVFPNLGRFATTNLGFV
jgi:uncharacterized protein (DUF1501 family)